MNKYPLTFLDRHETPRCFKAVIDSLPRCGQSIQEYANLKGYNPPDFTWLQTSLPLVPFQDLCFRYRTDVYSIMIAIQGLASPTDDRIVVDHKYYEIFLQTSKENNLIPCILPFSLSKGEPLADGIHLIHAFSGEPIIIEKDTWPELVPMSRWEIHSMGVQVVLQYLSEQGIEPEFYTDTLEKEPQIWFKKGRLVHYIIVRANPIGKRKEPFVIHRKSLTELKKSKGLFADVQFASSNPILKDENGCIVPLSKRDGDEDVWMWRGDGFHVNFKGLQEIETAIKENDFIQVVED